MKLKNLTTKFPVFVITGIIALSGAGTAFAADSSNSDQCSNGVEHQRVNFEEMSAIYQSTLDALVSKGTITQDQADAITENMSARGNKEMPAKDSKTALTGERKSPFSKLVSDGTITQEQVDAVREAMKTAKDSDQTKSDILDELVSAGTINQNQADAITESMPVRGDKEMPARNRKAAPTGEHKSPYSKLVSNGTITQDQADAISEAVKEEVNAAKESE